MDRLNPEIEKLFRAKERRRARLAAMPFHEKVQAVIQMQKMAAPLMRGRGRHVRIWELPPNLAIVAPTQERCYGIPMTHLAKTLDEKLATWHPEVAAQVEKIVTEVMELADANAVDILPSRAVVQEVLDTLDESQAR